MKQFLSFLLILAIIGTIIVAIVFGTAIIKHPLFLSIAAIAGAAVISAFSESIFAYYQQVIARNLSLKARVEANTKQILELQQKLERVETGIDYLDVDRWAEAIRLYKNFALEYDKRVVVVVLPAELYQKWQEDEQRLDFLIDFLTQKYSEENREKQKN